MADTAWRASRKPARGGVDNLVCVAASAEAIELSRIAHRVTVLLPWGSLLRGVALPEPSMLRALHALCVERAELEVVFSYQAGDALDPAMSPITEAHVAELPIAYAREGLSLARVTTLNREELRALGTTWAKRLGFGRPRTVWRLRISKDSDRR